MEGEAAVLSRQEFIRISIEMNLFFQRIMKEHLFFIETNLQPAKPAFIAKADILKQNFERLLSETVHYAKGIISEQVTPSNQFVTPYTLRAEDLTSRLTGARINTNITRNEYTLMDLPNRYHNEWLENVVFDLNRRSYYLLKEVITFKKQLLTLVLECKIFTNLYPEMLEHLIHEAEYYLAILKTLQERKLPVKTLCDELNFWNHIMGEHAQFIDGMLDPTEKNLKKIAEASAKEFEKLVAECIQTAEKQILHKSLQATQTIRDFKREATNELLKCKIKSIIPPLLADHVLREANHYLRLLDILKH
ncbi:MAG: hypothetical protein JG775_215 [Defluviitaleaceae bacterium]|jgi:hypothetical protein|nr:hypothetical protein [Defluviitaleaceae bacterium]